MWMIIMIILHSPHSVTVHKSKLRSRPIWLNLDAMRKLKQQHESNVQTLLLFPYDKAIPKMIVSFRSIMTLAPWYSAMIVSCLMIAMSPGLQYSKTIESIMASDTDGYNANASNQCAAGFEALKTVHSTTRLVLILAPFQNSTKQ